MPLEPREIKETLGNQAYQVRGCTAGVADLEEMPLFLGARTSDSILRSLYPLQVWLGLLASKVIKVGTVGIWAE